MAGQGAVVLRRARMGDVTWALHAQARAYRDEHGYAPLFETHLVQGLARYLEAHDPERDAFWVAEVDGQAGADGPADDPARAADGTPPRVGCVAVQHAPDRPGWAQLRWYLVERPWRGRGVGRRLLDEAVAFARSAGYGGILLWTVNDLRDAARVYGRAGFRVAFEAQAPCPWAPWGREQRWELPLPDAGRRPLAPQPDPRRPPPEGNEGLVRRG